MKPTAVQRLMVTFLLASAASLPARDVTIAVFDGAAPLVFVDEQGRGAGIVPELLAGILADVGHTPRFVTGLTFAEAFRAVVAGEIDFLPGAVISEERLAVLDFHREPIMVSWGQLGVLPDCDFASILDIRDRRIGLVRDGQNGINFVRMMQAFDVPFDAVEYQSHAEMADAIVRGEIDAGVFFSVWFHSQTRVVPSSIIFAPTQAFAATAKGTNADLRVAIDDRLVALKADETSYYYSVLDQYLGHAGMRELPRWVLRSGLITGVVVAVLLVFVVALRRAVRRKTRELATSRERYRTVAANAYGWEFWAAPDRRLVWVSPGTESVTGYPPEQFLEDPGLAERIIVPEDRPLWAAHVDELNEHPNRSRAPVIFRIRGADGTIRHIEHRCSPIQGEDGSYLGERGTNFDVTDRVLYAQQLELNVREKEAMLREIHHRVKNNLQTMASLLSLQRSTVTDSTVIEHLNTLAGRVHTMSLLHSAIYQEDSFGTVGMPDYLQLIVSHAAAAMAAGAPITTAVEVDVVELPLNAALPCGLIVNEAVTNSLKHAFPDGRGGTVRVAMAGPRDGIVSLVIEDDGVGADGASSTRGGREGSIGLPLMTTLADQLSGSLAIDRDAGFRIAVAFPFPARSN